MVRPSTCERCKQHIECGMQDYHKCYVKHYDTRSLPKVEFCLHYGLVPSDLRLHQPCICKCEERCPCHQPGGVCIAALEAPFDGPHADMYQTREITGSVGRPSSTPQDKWAVYEDQPDAVKDKCRRAGIPYGPGLDESVLATILPTLDRVDRRNGDLSLRIADLEKFQRRTAVLQTLALVATCVFFILAYLLKK